MRAALPGWSFAQQKRILIIARRDENRASFRHKIEEITMAAVGGARPGAGRPLGSTDSGKRLPRGSKQLARASPPGEEPMAYLLRIMRDPSADVGRRDRAAALLLPYRHARQAEVVLGRKAQAIEAARTAGEGTGWEYTDASGKTVNLLHPEMQPPTAGDENGDGDWGDDLKWDGPRARN
jgi:phage terminase small subunit